MDSVVAGLAAAAAGALLALAYLGGLAWTVQRLRTARRPVWWLVGSFALRGVLVAAGLVAIMQGDGARLLLAVGGFLLTRAAVLWIVRARHARETAGEAGT